MAGDAQQQQQPSPPQQRPRSPVRHNVRVSGPHGSTDTPSALSTPAALLGFSINDSDGEPVGGIHTVAEPLHGNAQDHHQHRHRHHRHHNSSAVTTPSEDPDGEPPAWAGQVATTIFTPLLRVLYFPLLEDDDTPRQRSRKLGIASLFCTTLCAAPLTGFTIAYPPTDSDGLMTSTAQIVSTIAAANALVFWPIGYAVARKFKSASMPASSIMGASLVVAQMVLTVAMPDFSPHIAWCCVLMLLLLMRVPALPAWLCVCFTFMGLGAWNAAVRAAGREGDFLIIEVPGAAPRSLEAHFIMYGILIAAAIIAVVAVAAQLYSHDRTLRLSEAGVDLALEVVDALETYDTKAASAAVAEAALFGDASAELMVGLRVLIDHLEQFRPHLPNWVLPVTKEDEEDEEDSADAHDSIRQTPQNESDLSSLAASISPSTSSPQFATVAPNGLTGSSSLSTTPAGGKSGWAAVRRRSFSVLSLTSRSNSDNPLSVNASRRTSPRDGLRPSESKANLSRSSRTGFNLNLSSTFRSDIQVASVLVDVTSVAGVPDSSMSAASSGAASGAKILTPERAAALDGFVQAAHRHCSTSKGALHSFVGDQLSVSWGAAVACEEPCVRAVRFVFKLLALGSPDNAPWRRYLQLSAAVAGGNSAAYLAGAAKTQRVLTIRGQWSGPLRSLADAARAVRTVAVSDFIRDQTAHAFNFRPSVVAAPLDESAPAAVSPAAQAVAAAAVPKSVRIVGYEPTSEVRGDDDAEWMYELERREQAAAAAAAGGGGAAAGTAAPRGASSVLIEDLDGSSNPPSPSSQRQQQQSKGHRSNATLETVLARWTASAISTGGALEALVACSERPSAGEAETPETVKRLVHSMGVLARII